MPMPEATTNISDAKAQGVSWNQGAEIVPLGIDRTTRLAVMVMKTAYVTTRGP